MASSESLRLVQALAQGPGSAATAAFTAAITKHVASALDTRKIAIAGQFYPKIR